MECVILTLLFVFLLSSFLSMTAFHELRESFIDSPSLSTSGPPSQETQSLSPTRFGIKKEEEPFRRTEERLIENGLQDTQFDNEIMQYQVQHRRDAPRAPPVTTSAPPPQSPATTDYESVIADQHVYMPAHLWKAASYRAPVCATQTTNIVQPVFTDGYTADIMEFTGVGSIMPLFQYTETPTAFNHEKKYYDRLVMESKRRDAATLQRSVTGATS